MSGYNLYVNFLLSSYKPAGLSYDAAKPFSDRYKNLKFRTVPLDVFGVTAMLEFYRLNGLTPPDYSSLLDHVRECLINFTFPVTLIDYTEFRGDFHECQRPVIKRTQRKKRKKAETKKRTA